MNYSTVLLVSVALGIDAFSVAIGIGAAGVGKKQMLAVAVTVMFFHILMPLLGLSLGAYLGNIAGPIAGSIGALVLVAIGLSAVWGGIRDLGVTGGGTGIPVISISGPVSLALVAASVSLDALTVGFGLGALRVDLFLTVLTMGVVAGIMTGGGLIFGRGLNRAFGKKAEIIGGIILVIIGLKLLF